MGEREFTANFIGGRWRGGSAGVLQNCSPTDGSVINEFAGAGLDDACEAIEAASAALREWSRMPAPKRGEILFRAGELLARRREEAAVLMSREMGKPIREARGEIARSIDLFRYYGGWGWRMGGQRFPSATESFIYTVPVPLGLVSLITPWNFPSAIPAWKALPALIVGNTVVLKPASQAPASAILIAQCLQEAGLPDGVLNIVCGRGATVSEPMLTDQRVRAVSFTGSCETGQMVFEKANTPKRRVGLELGGKNPLLVAADADIDRAIALATAGAMGLAGQKCTATSRVIVHEKIADTFTEKLIERVKQLRIGDPLDEDTDVGPVIDASAMEGILGYIESGKKQGAKILAGGEKLTEGKLGKGFFVAPTVLGDVEPHMKVAQEEIFGPVLAVMRASDFDHAIDIANDIAYGLSAAICTDDIKLAQNFIDRIEAGLVHINSTTSGAEAHVPFGGTKASSSGFREMGEAGIDFYSTVKTVYYQ